MTPPINGRDDPLKAVCPKQRLKQSKFAEIGRKLPFRFGVIEVGEQTRRNAVEGTPFVLAHHQSGIKVRWTVLAGSEPEW